MSASTVQVTIDDRIRLVAAALAATDFPDTSQQLKRHHAHAHARATVKYLRERKLTDHPAIQSMQSLLDKNAPVEALFTLVMHFSWPELDVQALPRWVPDNWNKQLWAFYNDADLKTHWENASVAWENAEKQAKRVFKDVEFRSFLEPFVSAIDEEFVFMPNISYPADNEIGIRVNNQLICIAPPPLAWGESPPWPFDEESLRAQHTYRAALSQYARLLMLAYLRKHSNELEDITDKELPLNDRMKEKYPTWEQQFIALFTTAAVAIYLEDHVSKTEARGYILMEKKVHNMTILPGAVSVMRRYLQEHGNKFDSLLDFLPVFPAQLRVARRIVTM
jgi:hypothetical protein